MKATFEIISEGGITSPKGFFAGATYAGIKRKSKGVLDLSVLYSEVTCTAAGVFTTNKVKAAPVLLDQQKLQQNGKARAVVINAGCANACTGEQGMANAAATADLLAKQMGINPDEVMVASTGVIGVQLPMDKIQDGISRIALSREAGHDLARAIMTTDTRPKEIAVKVKSGSAEFTIAGVAKGAGMIHPNMATMLCFLATDAEVEGNFLNLALKKAIDLSINLVTVDGDTSTNDTAIILANGLAMNEAITPGSRRSSINASRDCFVASAKAESPRNDENVNASRDCHVISPKGELPRNDDEGNDEDRNDDIDFEMAEAFQQGLDQVCLYLAKSIARDGEGATRMIEVVVNGAVSLDDARLAARTIANSPLVKTAVHGCDPNWGRIICAAGRSGAELVPEKADVYIDDICLFKTGKPLTFDKKAAAAKLDCGEVSLRMDFHLGKASATAWGCDLSEEYVVINSEYTT